MDDTGKVDFAATYAEGLIRVHWEIVFRRGGWVYVAGEIEGGASVPDPIKVGATMRVPADPKGSSRNAAAPEPNDW